MGRFGIPGMCNCCELVAMRKLSICAFFVMLMSCRLLCAQDNNPPRIEIGPVMSSAKQYTLGDYHVGGGGRATFNVNRFLGAEVESTRQPTDNLYIGDEVHTSF